MDKIHRVVVHEQYLDGNWGILDFHFLSKQKLIGLSLLTGAKNHVTLTEEEQIALGVLCGEPVEGLLDKLLEVRGAKPSPGMCACCQKHPAHPGDKAYRCEACIKEGFIIDWSVPWDYFE